MKKIFSFVIVLAAVAMISCGGNATKPAEAVVEVEATEVVATEAVDSTACPAQCDSIACPKSEGAECTKK